MKIKKIIFIFVLFIGLLISISATDIRFHSDSGNGWYGYSGADYVGTTKTVNPSQFAEEAENRAARYFRIVRYCEKLSRQENFLLWSALNQYNYSNNEVYSVIIQQGYECLNLIVVIKDNGNSCDWYGGAYWRY